MVTFPRETGPAIVDWVDYADAVNAASPAHFADVVAHRPRAGTRSGWSGSRGTRPTASSARRSPRTSIAAATKTGGGGHNVVTNHPALYYEPMNLTEYAFSGT